MTKISKKTADRFFSLFFRTQKLNSETTKLLEDGDKYWNDGNNLWGKDKTQRVAAGKLYDKGDRLYEKASQSRTREYALRHQAEQLFLTADVLWTTLVQISRS